ncbi:glycosyl hydrolase family 18 protein [Nocardioides pantholopis]|uniref:glycosyl hydrolase family 18 protein n=1 Tax=Nocardioides pantholopis TaxID=2483798 RepID=UPI000FD6BC2E|nr:glycosyl hydrolase family 18 protein [Nocardioides pantholopis]
MPLRLAVGALVTASLLTAALPALTPAPSRAAAAQPEPAVTGYALGDTPGAVVRRDAAGLQTLTVVASALRRDGRGVSRPGAGPVRLVRAAHRHGLRAELLVNNYSNRLGGFDRIAARRLLRHPDRVRAVAGRLARFATGQGWDGVNLDLELLGRRDADGLVLLATELQRRMPERLTVSVDVSARTSVSGYRRAGYRLGPLGRAADVVQLMAYDLHGPSWSGPGPIGPLRWQRRVLGALLSRVPADRVDLGVAGYGYTWPRRGTRRVGRSIDVAQARRLARRDGVRPRWVARSGEWTARLSDGTRLWWSDRRSWRLRTRLARDRGLHGLALWRLGSADPLR